MDNISYQPLFQVIAEQSGEGISLADVNGNYILVNPAFCQMTGYSEAELLTMNVRELLPPQTELTLLPQVIQAKSGRREIELLRKDGSRFLAEVSAYPVEWSGRKLVLGIVRDITERKQAAQERLQSEAALSESEARFRLLFEQAPLPYHSLDAAGTIIDVNPMWLETLGYSRQEVIGRSLIDFLPPENHEQFYKNLNCFKKEGKIDAKLELIKKSGETLIAAFTGKIGRDKIGRFLQTHCIFADITARQQTEKRVRQLSRAVEASPLSIIITNVDGYIEYINPWFTQLTGYTQEEVQGQTPRILKSGRVPDETYKALWQTILSGHEWRGELVNKKKNGELFWDLVSISPIMDQAGKITHFIGIQTDITARKQAEEKIAALAEFNENIVASAPVGIVTVNTEGQITSANSAFLKMVGSPNLEKTLGLDMSIPSIKAGGIDVAVDEVLTSGQTFSIDKLPYTSHWGKKLIVNLKVVPQKTKDGRISGMIVVVDDVTVAARAEVLQTAVYRIAQAADRAASLDELFPAIHEIIKTVMPADNFYIALYDEERDMLHFRYHVDEKKITRQPSRRPHDRWTEFVLRSGTSQLVDIRHHQAMVQRGKVENSDPEAVVWLGVPLIVETRTIGVMAVKHYRDPNAYGKQEQHMLEYVASQVAQTIDRKQKEDALRRRGRKMRSLASLAQKLEQARTHTEIIEPLQEEISTVLGYQTTWIYLFDKDRNYWWLLSSAGTKAQDLNERAQILRIEGDAFLEEITEANHIVVVEDARTDPRTNKEIVAQLNNRTIINVPIFLENERLGSIATGSFGDEGVRVPSQFGLEYLKAISRHVAVVIDRIQFLIERVKSEQILQISNRQLQAAMAKLKETQERMVQRERLAAVGQLAAGMAHDFNNIIAVIVLYTEMGLRFPNLSPELQERLQTILHQAWRATDLVGQILDFSRRTVLEPQAMDLTPFLKEQIKMLTRTLPENIRLDLTYGADEYTVNVDPTRMQQVIVNLLVNARDAMPDGGKLRVGLSRATANGDIICAECQRPIYGDWVQIQIEDSGSGISSSVMSHIFEPFFTTKQAGQGSGLGLSQVAGIIDQHKGHITVESEVGQGTTFVIYLPALSIEPREDNFVEVVNLPHGAGETILVVEDDAVTRGALAESIELLNYRVITAVNGKEALLILEQRPQEIDLVLSDLVMPEMGGQALFQTMKQRNMNMPVVMLSGHPLESNLQELQEQGVAGWLSKPPSLKKLAELLANALNQENE